MTVDLSTARILIGSEQYVAYPADQRSYRVRFATNATNIAAAVNAQGLPEYADPWEHDNALLALDFTPIRIEASADQDTNDDRFYVDVTWRLPRVSGFREPERLRPGDPPLVTESTRLISQHVQTDVEAPQRQIGSTRYTKPDPAGGAPEFLVGPDGVNPDARTGTEVMVPAHEITVSMPPTTNIPNTFAMRKLAGMVNSTAMLLMGRAYEKNSLLYNGLEVREAANDAGQIEFFVTHTFIEGFSDPPRFPDQDQNSNRIVQDWNGSAWPTPTERLPIRYGFYLLFDRAVTREENTQGNPPQVVGTRITNDLVTPRQVRIVRLYKETSFAILGIPQAAP